MPLPGMSMHDHRPLGQPGIESFLHIANHRPRLLQKAPRTALLLLKPLLQALLLLWMMFVRLPSPRVLLLQLPPTIPTMAICSLATWWHSARLIHDWHNFGYTLMAMSLGRRHWLVSSAALIDVLMTAVA